MTIIRHKKKERRELILSVIQSEHTIQRKSITIINKEREKASEKKGKREEKEIEEKMKKICTTFIE